MNRDHPHPFYTFNCGGSSSAAGGGDFTGKAKMWPDEQNTGGDDDQLLAVLGYKVKSSDMADVADKIQHLEQALVNDDDLSQLASDSIHYNPSDMSTWLRTIMGDLDTTPQSPPPVINDSTGANVTPAGPVTVVPNTAFMENDNIVSLPIEMIQPPGKRLKPSSPLISNNPNVVLVNFQHNGIRLVQTLMACAEAVELGEFQSAENLVKEAGILAVNQIGPMKKVAAYFSEALARRIYRFHHQIDHTPKFTPAFNDLLRMHFYEACPYLKFAHFTANQAILKAFTGKKSVHVIDFSMKQGIQWPALLQALSVRPGGTPSFRLTAIGIPPDDNANQLQEYGLRLLGLANTVNVKFEFRSLMLGDLADIEPAMLDLRDGEVVSVNSILQLHQLLARPGVFEKLLSSVKAMKPEIVTVVEQEANHNVVDFMERFNECIQYYSAIFDSLEITCNSRSGSPAVNTKDKIMSEVYLGKQICNVVACEGEDRVERHETFTQWKTRFDSAGFQVDHFGSNAYRQASILLEIFTGVDGYKVAENDGCLMLTWHTRPLITTSAWKLKRAPMIQLS